MGILFEHDSDLNDFLIGLKEAQKSNCNKTKEHID
jgi:hypothetical protein